MIANQGRIDDQELIYASDEACHCGGSSHRRHASHSNPSKCSSVRAIALTLFLLASAYWFYKVYTNATGGHDLLGWESPATKAARHQQASTRSQLKLISVFNRHGDRSPSDSLPPGDDIAQHAELFWPRGLNNLTDSGRYRQFRLGLELRRRYERHLDYEATHFLALSSPMQRCRDSLELTLAGLFDIDWTLPRGLELVRQFNAACKRPMGPGAPRSCNISQLHLPTGSGSPLEWKQIPIDSSTMPMLEYSYLNACKYRLDNPTPVDVDLEASAELAKLKGLDQLKLILLEKYQQKFNFSALGLWSTLAGELRLARTDKSIAWGQHSFDWVTQQVTAYAGNAPITLFDLYEAAALLGYRDRIVGTARLVQLGPLITSLVTSQEVALAGETNQLQVARKLEYDSRELYRNKKAVIYSSHDSILQLLMHHLGVIRANANNYAQQFNKWHKANDADQLLQGLRMSQFGMSLVFELYEMAPVATATATALNEQSAIPQAKFAHLQAALYNEADPKYKPVEFQRLDLGRICRRLFEEQNPGAPSSSVDAFYQHDKFPLDEARNCPFELFRNVTRNMLIGSQELNKLCAS